MFTCSKFFAGAGLVQQVDCAAVAGLQKDRALTYVCCGGVICLGQRGSCGNLSLAAWAKSKPPSGAAHKCSIRLLSFGECFVRHLATFGAGYRRYASHVLHVGVACGVDLASERHCREPMFSRMYA